MAVTTNYVVARTSAVLSASGAYDSSPTVIGTQLYDKVAFLIGYTRGAAGGAVTYKIEFSNDGSAYGQTTELMSGTFTAGSDTTQSQQKVSFIYTSTGAAIEVFWTPQFINMGNWVRINVKESGVTATPGTVVIQAALMSNI